MKLLLLVLSLIFSLVYQTTQTSSPQTCSRINLFSLETGLSCLIDADSSIQIPLSAFYSLQTSSKLSINISNGHHNSGLLLSRNSEEDVIHIQFISKDVNTAFTISKDDVKTLTFISTESSFSFTFNQNLPKIQGFLNKSTKYTFTTQFIKTSNNPLHSNRFLFQCPEGTFEADGMCVRVCPVKFYKDNNVCKACPVGCGLCLSGTQCNNCQGVSNFDPTTKDCVNECPEGYFQDFNNRICVQCSEGCLKCTFPDGECISSSFKRDMIINLIICLVMVGLITLCAYYCNKETPEEQNQPAQSQEDQSKEKSKHDIQQQEEKPKKKGHYNMLYEDGDAQEGVPEEDMVPTRRKKKRLTDFAKNRLLNISMSKPFEVDDGNQDKAISHDSANKLFSTSNSPMINYRSRLDLSPLTASKSPLLSSYVGTRPNLLSTNMDDQKSERTQLQEKQNPIAVTKARNILFNMEDSPLKQSRENLKRQLQNADEKKDAAPLASSSVKVEYQEFDTSEDDYKKKSYKDVEVVREVSEPEKEEETEGYKPDLSISSAYEKDENEDFSSCTVCGMNKRDCIIQPCRHTIACYACMEQWRESYGVCPRCQKMITGIQKIQPK